MIGKLTSNREPSCSRRRATNGSLPSPGPWGPALWVTSTAGDTPASAEAGLGCHEEDRGDQEDAHHRAHDALRASPSLIGRWQIAERELAISGVRERVLDDRQQFAVGGDEEEDVDQGDQHENRDRGADPQVAVVPVALIHL